MRSNDIWMRYKDSKGNETNNVKHILALLDCRKMIPVIDGFYEGVDFTSSDDDSEDDAKYKDLLEKEYSFCVTNKEKILKKRTKYMTSVKTKENGYQDAVILRFLNKSLFHIQKWIIHMLSSRTQSNNLLNLNCSQNRSG